jgi:PhoPQ-activated pathogenicity-related protein
MSRFILSLFLSSLLLISCKQEPPTPETALHHYLHNGDKAFAWEVMESFDSASAKAFNLLLTSQQWREYTWKHQLTLIVPPKIEYDGALLFITGGSNKNSNPNLKAHDDDAIKMMTQVALQNNAMTAVLYQVPNQPLFGELVEDEIISHTLHQYRQDKDLTWPLLFPMVKSAVRAMDAIQDFSVSELDQPVERFVVSGASKRGWTTWLTGANDTRVTAIAPMVIDVLNMPVSLEYHKIAWGDYSVQIQDYVNLEIPQAVSTPDGDALVAMIDPYSYRAKLTMPKMIFIGTNDEYWPVDAIKNYIDDIPGENYIHYTPNAGHDLGGGKKALETLSAFFGETLTGQAYPACAWEVAENETNVQLKVTADQDKLQRALLWSAESVDRDFRDDVWTSTAIETAETPVIVDLPFPSRGFKAFYVDLIYASVNGDNYAKSTRMFVVDSTQLLR